MSTMRGGARALVWLFVPIAAIGICALGGGAVGSVIGNALGSPEGEGFIGFVYGLWAGAAAGLAAGVFAAWRLDTSLRTGTPV